MLRNLTRVFPYVVFCNIILFIIVDWLFHIMVQYKFSCGSTYVKTAVFFRGCSYEKYYVGSESEHQLPAT